MSLPFKFPQKALLWYDEQRPASCEELVGRPYSAWRWVTEGLIAYLKELHPKNNEISAKMK